MTNSDILTELHAVITARLEAEPATSYVASLAHQGIDAVLQKVGEEATEAILAAKNGDTEKIIYETADLWFHSLIMLAQQGVQPQQVMDELAQRFGTSGLQEKASRATN